MMIDNNEEATIIIIGLSPHNQPVSISIPVPIGLVNAKHMYA